MLLFNSGQAFVSFELQLGIACVLKLRLPRVWLVSCSRKEHAFWTKKASLYIVVSTVMWEHLYLAQWGGNRSFIEALMFRVILCAISASFYTEGLVISARACKLSNSA